jgi:hypothetical protein
MLDRCGATALIVGGVFGVVSHLMHPWMPPSTQQTLATYARTTPRAHVLLLCALLLVSLGLPSLFRRLRPTTGLLVFLSMPLLYVGLMLFEVLHCPIEIGLVPLLPSLDYPTATRLIEGIYAPPSLYFWINIAGVPLLLLGIIFLIIGSRRSRSLSRWPQLLLAAVPLLIICSFLPIKGMFPMLAEHAFPICLYLGFAAYGAALIAPPRVSEAVAG